jgi:hypothetical protein
MRVDTQHVIPYGVKDLNLYLTEASTIGLKPGEWPEAIEATIGNGEQLLLSHVRPDGSRVYTQRHSTTVVHVLND